MHYNSSMHYQNQRVEGVMLLIQLAFYLSARAYYKWAMNEIPRTIGLHHPDVAKIMVRQREIEDKLEVLLS